MKILDEEERSAIRRFVQNHDLKERPRIEAALAAIGYTNVYVMGDTHEPGAFFVRIYPDASPNLWEIACLGEP